MSASLSDDDQRRLLFALETAFRPGAPIDRADLFSGRTDQMAAVVQAAGAPGQHAVIFGERGVGKTSLAAVCVDIARSNDRLALRINCDRTDNFASLWQKVIDEFPIVLEELPEDAQRTQALRRRFERATELLNADEITPNAVRLALRHVAVEAPIVVFMDEFDQIADEDTLVLVSNTMKVLSDQIENVTLVPVGVSGSVDGLIRAHGSVQRAFVQVHMPRMTTDEIVGIITKGFEQLGATAPDEVLRLLMSFPRGLPQYAHLIAQEACRAALQAGRREITSADVIGGLRAGLARVDYTLRHAYEQATYSPRPARFREVLAACAVTPVDESGYFAPSEVRPPYSAIIGEDVDIPRFNPHLVQLCEGRGQILSREGGDRRWRYRFTDPLMEPYVLMKGISDGLLDPYLSAITRR